MLQSVERAIPIRRSEEPSQQGAIRFVKLEGPLSMHRGGELPEAVIAYECWGQLNEARDNTVLLFTGLSPSAHAASSPEEPIPGW